MASAIIHICVAKRVNAILKMPENLLCLGAIAPDINKQIGKDKKTSHFFDENHFNIPDIDFFLQKYQNDLNHPFTMGYLIHLLTDKYWFQEFVPHYLKQHNISKTTFSRYLYQDYMNLNIRLIDEYELKLNIFYETIPKIDTKITEIPIEKMNILVNNMSIMLENSKNNPINILAMEKIKNFIEPISNKIKEFVLLIQE